MSALYRELAPITEAAWQEIDEEARRTLKLALAARKLVDFVGPLGWRQSAVDLVRTQDLRSPGDGIEAKLRLVQPLTEVRVAFELQRAELDAISRGSKDADLAPVTQAAQSIAKAEDRAVFAGFAAANIVGVEEAAKGATLDLSDDYQRYPAVVASALSTLRNAGVAGPYGIALGPRCYKGLTETTTSGGYPVYEHVRRLLDGPLVWAPAVDGAAVLSLRGGDFELTVGQDMSIGYLDHTRTAVRLYIQESFTFRVLAAEAAVPLKYTSRGRRK
jgi:uncharacterized linocin/CFP29 family protein